jgi:hypothetical protein
MPAPTRSKPRSPLGIPKLTSSDWPRHWRATLRLTAFIEQDILLRIKQAWEHENDAEANQLMESLQSEIGTAVFHALIDMTALNEVETTVAISYDRSESRS